MFWVARLCFDSEKACRPHLAAQSTTTATSDPNCHCKKVHTERTSPVSTIKEKHQAPHPTRHHHHGWDHDRKPHGMTNSTGPRHTKPRGHKALSPQTPPQCHHLLFSRSQRTQHTPQRYHATATAKSITPNTTMDASLAQTPPPTTASTTQTPSHPNLSSTQSAKSLPNTLTATGHNHQLSKLTAKAFTTKATKTNSDPTSSITLVPVYPRVLG